MTTSRHRWVPYDGSSDPVPVRKRKGWRGAMQLKVMVSGAPVGRPQPVAVPVAEVMPPRRTRSRGSWDSRVYGDAVDTAPTRRAAMRLALLGYRALLAERGTR